MCLNECVADKESVFMRDENFLFSENHSSDTVSGTGHALAVKFADVLVSCRAVNSSAVAVQPEVEWRSVLNDSYIQR